MPMTLTGLSFLSPSLVSPGRLPPLTHTHSPSLIFESLSRLSGRPFPGLLPTPSLSLFYFLALQESVETSLLQHGYLLQVPLLLLCWTHILISPPSKPFPPLVVSSLQIQKCVYSTLHSQCLGHWLPHNKS